MDKKLKNHLIVVAFGVMLYAAVMNIGTVWGFAKALISLALPLVIGFVAAFVLNVPMSAIERRLTKLLSGKKRAPGKKLLRLASLLLTLTGLALVLVLICTLIIPEFVSSVKSLYELVIQNWPDWLAKAEALLLAYNVDTAWFEQYFANIDIQKIVGDLLSGTGNVISSALNIFSTALSSVTTVAIGMVLAIYILLSKDRLANGSSRLLRAFMRDPVTDYILHVARLVNATYSKFLSGQCVEACILGSLIFVVFSFAGIPYASITGLLTAVCAFIPYVGAFASCFIGAVLVLLAAPGKLILCIILYLVVQFVENQFIYPHVVGSSVGLGAMWTLIAVIVGGKLLGLLGMIFFIPLLAVIMSLVREQTDKALKKKEGDKTPPPPEAAQSEAPAQ